eukprot:1188831-Prorocentrum_minimum.AAC.2
MSVRDIPRNWHDHRLSSFSTIVHLFPAFGGDVLTSTRGIPVSSARGALFAHHVTRRGRAESSWRLRPPDQGTRGQRVGSAEPDAEPPNANPRDPTPTTVWCRCLPAHARERGKLRSDGPGSRIPPKNYRCLGLHRGRARVAGSREPRRGFT